MLLFEAMRWSMALRQHNCKQSQLKTMSALYIAENEASLDPEVREEFTTMFKEILNANASVNLTECTSNLLYFLKKEGQEIPPVFVAKLKIAI